MKPIQTALVTGGASGMGRSMALRLADRGADVAVVDLDQARLDAVVAEANELSGSLIPFVCDVSDLAQVEKTVAEAIDVLGPLDRLVHCAALMPGGRVADVATEDIVRLMDINFGGTVAFTKAVLPGMLERRTGQIVLFGSSAGYVYNERFAAYDATKAAVNAFTEVLAQECRNTGVQVLLVAPPTVNTPLLDQAVDGPPILKRKTVRRRALKPEQVVDAVERGLDRGRMVLVLGDAKAAYAIRRLSPRLTWRVMRMIDR